MRPVARSIIRNAVSRAISDPGVGGGSGAAIAALIETLGVDLLAWWSDRDASQFVVAGGVVTSWTDLKSGIVATPPSEGARPAYTGGRIIFDGTADVCIAANTTFPSGSAPCEIWCLVDQQAPSPTDIAERHIAGYGDNSFSTQRAIGRMHSAANLLAAKIGDGTNNNATATSGDFSGVHLVRMTVGATATNLYLDSVLVGTKGIVPTTTAPKRVFIGSAVFGSGIYFWKGGIRDVLFTLPLSAEKESAVNDFFT